MGRLTDVLPTPLVAEITSGRWLPIVGSGLSRNALVSTGSPPPDWVGLARTLRSELSDPDEIADPVEIISAYSHEHGRPALVERVGLEIRVADSSPAPVHRALCQLPVDSLATTNFDFLLEAAFREVGKPCHPVVDEHQLSIRNPYPGPVLYKIHGDLHRPDRMVLTESDFDSYLVRNPLYATVLSAELATKSSVLIGYSLGDPDLRQLLAVIRERLGAGARMMYSLEVDPPQSKVARFARRNVTVVPLAGDRHDPAPTLTALFSELYEEVRVDAPSRLVARTHESGLALAGGATGPSCFVSAPLRSLPDYREWLSPVAADQGIVLVSAEDFVAPGDAVLAKIEAVIASVGCAIVEVGTPWTSIELGMALNRLGPARILAIVGEEPLSVDAPGIRTIRRPQSHDEWARAADEIVAWMTQVLRLGDRSGVVAQDLVGEVISVAADIEGILRFVLDEDRSSLSQLIAAAGKAGVLSPSQTSTLRRFSKIRNDLAHGAKAAPPGTDIRRALQGARRVLERLSDDFHSGRLPREY